MGKMFNNGQDSAMHFVVTDGEGRHRSGRNVYFVMRLFAHVIVVLIPVVILVLMLTPLGDVLGIRLGWFGLPPGAGMDEVKAVQTKAVQESMRDMLTVIVPLFLGVVVWMVTIVAERRLKVYDDTLDKFRDDIKKANDTFRKEILDAEERIEERVEKVVLATVVKTATDEMNKLVSEASATFSEETEESRQKLNKIRDGMEERFGGLAETTEYAKEIGPMTSVGVVKQKVTSLLFEEKRAEAANLTLQLLDVFKKGRTDHSKRRPSGSLNDWFNFSAVLGARDEEGMALQVCLAGLEQQGGVRMPEDMGAWPADILPYDELIAHAIKYAEEVNAPELPGLISLSGYDPATRRGRSSWGWRSYGFVLEGLDALGRGDEAVDLGRAYMDQAGTDPDQQKVLVNLAGVMAARGERAVASQMLKDWLNNNPTLPGAQVVTWLIDKELGGVRAEQIIEWSDRGIRDLAEEQPSSDLANLFYNRALARDWLAHEAANNGNSDAVNDQAPLAVADFKQALHLDINPSLRRNVAARINLLGTLLERHGGSSGDSFEDEETDGQPEIGEGDTVAIKRALLLLNGNDGGPELYAALRDLLKPVPMGLKFLDHLARDGDAPPALRAKVRGFLDWFAADKGD